MNRGDKRLLEENAEAAAQAGGGAARDEAPTPAPPPKKKAARFVVDGPARGRADDARAETAAAETTATAAPAPEPEHWLGSTECPVCLEDWDVNKPSRTRICCCKAFCSSCNEKLTFLPCPLCRTPMPESDDEKLAMLRRHVADDANPVATYLLALSYARGDLGLVKSDEKAARLYERAADLGDVGAMFQVGVAYDYGRGVKLDKKKAAKYFRMAADRGHAAAQFHLGCCFADDDGGVAQDDAESVRLYMLAADQGLTQAEYILGCMYEDGFGVAARDYAEAIRWYERAAANGYEKAKRALARARANICAL